MGRLLIIARCIQTLCRFDLRALRVVARSYRQPVFVHGTFTLACDIEDAAEQDVRPDQSPGRLLVAVQGFAKGVGRGLETFLPEKDLPHAIVGERTGAIVF